LDFAAEGQAAESNEQLRSSAKTASSGSSASAASKKCQPFPGLAL